MNNLPNQPDSTEITVMIQTARQKAYQTVNQTMIDLYWQIGNISAEKLLKQNGAIDDS